MARISEERKAEILSAISEHLLVDGPRNWDILLAKYPDLSRPTLFRYVKEVRERLEDQVGKHGAGALRLAQKRIRAAVEPAAKTTERVKAHLPSSPSPAVIAGQDAHIEQLFDFMAFFGKILKDADMVRDSAVAKNEDGTERLKNPMVMDRSIARRLGIIETYLHTQDTIYNLEKLQELYRIVINAVGQADPETQQAILAELRQANNMHGITMAARVR